MTSNALEILKSLAPLEQEAPLSDQETATVKLLLTGLRLSPETHALLTGLASGIDAHCRALGVGMREESAP